jgi:putative transcriptional regulator
MLNNPLFRDPCNTPFLSAKLIMDNPGYNDVTISMLTDLRKDIQTILDKSGFITSQLSGSGGMSFDLISRRDDLLILMKLSISAEGLSRNLSGEMLTLSRVLKGSPILLLPSSPSQRFQDGVLYVRYGVPLMTLNTLFDYLIEEVPPMIYKGSSGFFVTLDGTMLRTRRNSLNISLGALADAVGVSRRAIQMYESGMGADLEVALKLENILRVPLILPLDPFSTSEELQAIRDGLDVLEGMKKEVLEHLDSIGMEVIPTQKCPFDALAREKKELLLASVGGSKEGLQHKAENLSRISKVTGGDQMVVVSDKIRTRRIGDTPVMRISEIKGAKDVERLIQLIRER